MTIRRWIWILLLLAILMVAALPTLLYPLTRDQGAYAYIAGLMMRGGVPYRDAWDLKPPAIYLTYMLAFSLFGRTEFAVRLFDVLFTLLSSIALYFLAQETLRDRRIATLSAWLYALCYYWMVRFYSAANPESFMVPFLIVAALGLVRGLRTHGGWWFLVAGAASGSALWFKPTAGVVVLGLLLWAVLHAWRENWPRKEAVRALVSLGCGGCLGVLPMGVYLYGRGLQELLELWSIYGTGTYLGAHGLALGTGPLAMLDVIVTSLREWQLLVWLTLAGTAILLLQHQRVPESVPAAGQVLIAFLLSSAFMVLVQRKLFEYHWIPILAPAAILSAASGVWLADEWNENVASRKEPSVGSLVAAIAVFGLLFLMAYDRLPQYRRTLAYLRGRISAEQYYEQFDIGRDFSHTGTVAAAGYLREHTNPEETALIWGAEPLVHFWAQRRAFTKYIFSYMLVNESSDLRLAALRDGLMRELHQNPPAYVVLVQNDAHPLSPGGSLSELQEFPEFERWLELECQFEEQVEDYLFYRCG